MISRAQYRDALESTHIDYDDESEQDRQDKLHRLLAKLGVEYETPVLLCASCHELIWNDTIYVYKDNPYCRKHYDNRVEGDKETAEWMAIPEAARKQAEAERMALWEAGRAFDIRKRAKEIAENA